MTIYSLTVGVDTTIARGVDKPFLWEIAIFRLVSMTEAQMSRKEIVFIGNGDIATTQKLRAEKG